MEAGHHEERRSHGTIRVVRFEMLTGKRLFAGETVSDTRGAVLTREPDWSALPATTPGSVRALLSDGLVREPKQR